MQSPQSQSSQSQLPQVQVSQSQVSHLQDEQSQSSQLHVFSQQLPVAFASTATGQAPSQSLTEQLHSVQSHAPHFFSSQSHASHAHSEPQLQSTVAELADKF